jgi:hypothetical protein
MLQKILPSTPWCVYCGTSANSWSFCLYAYENDLKTSSYEGTQTVSKIIVFVKCRKTRKSDSYSGYTGLDSKSKDRISFDVGLGFAQCYLKKYCIMSHFRISSRHSEFSIPNHEVDDVCSAHLSKLS